MNVGIAGRIPVVGAKLLKIYEIVKLSLKKYLLILYCLMKKRDEEA